jgi:hypothetical protein
MKKLQMPFRIWVLIPIFFVLGIIGCSPQILALPSHIHTVGVAVFQNQTSRYGLETELTSDIIQQFQVDGRLSVVSPSKADLLVKGRILYYSRDPILYNTTNNLVLQYRLVFTYDVEAIDQTDGRSLFEEKNQMGTIFYYTNNEPGAITQTQDQAENQLMQETAQIIVHKILLGY